MIDTIVAVCQTKAESDNWVSLLQKHSNNSSPTHEPGQPQSLPHVSNFYSSFDKGTVCHEYCKPMREIKAFSQDLSVALEQVTQARATVFVTDNGLILYV